MIRLRTAIVVTALIVILAVAVRAKRGAALVLWQRIPIPDLKDGDFDHFAVDLQNQRLSLTAEANSAVEVLDLRSNKLIDTISDVKTPHSIVYRAEFKRLFVVDGGSPGVKIFDGDSYKAIDTSKLLPAADSMAYDPATKYMYVVNGGDDAQMTYSRLSAIDATSAKKVADGC
jgi:DNA-binding beta-propeller fold protein YncE